MSPDPIFLARVARGLSPVRTLTGWRRAGLDDSVLRRALPLRLAAARHRATLPEARARLQQFTAASASYATALDDVRDLDAHVGVVPVDGLTWSVPLSDPGDRAAVERYTQHQDFPYRAITQTRELGLGGIMLDIGGNNGRMSIPRVILGDAQAVYCAEPEPLNYACLVRNVRDNGLEGLVLPDRVAIGSENTTVRLVRAKSPGGHKVIDPGMRSKRETIDVPSLTMDTWCARLGIDLQQVSFVKVDAQGSEVHVLRGAGRLLACRHVAWQIEIDPSLLGDRGFRVDDLYDLLRRHFTHYVDLNRRAKGARVRSIDDVAAGLAYLAGQPGAHTDVVVFSLGTES
jgi:FkbM family methyltransferase